MFDALARVPRSSDRSNARALARAREAIGAPFRLHGRDLRGMDCVGLAAWAWEAPAPTGYALRASPRARIERELAALGFVRADMPGAIVLAAPGPGQLHLGISTGEGIVHADASARRVIERAAPLPWPIVASWIRED
ncbi:MAG: peptidoglycan endopeptidase [Proteobacteria bacterium]|nr:peptidoglycan endopeptidase [Pseudomonadota bacterium]